MTIPCEGCGKQLENYNALKKTWDEVSTGKPHDCPEKEKLREALKAKRDKLKSTDKNVEKYAVQMIKCAKCGATYSNILDKCPNCKREFIKSLFRRTK